MLHHVTPCHTALFHAVFGTTRHSCGTSAPDLSPHGFCSATRKIIPRGTILAPRRLWTNRKIHLLTSNDTTGGEGDISTVWLPKGSISKVTMLICKSTLSIFKQFLLKQSYYFLDTPCGTFQFSCMEWPKLSFHKYFHKDRDKMRPKATFVVLVLETGDSLDVAPLCNSSSRRAAPILLLSLYL